MIKIKKNFYLITALVILSVIFCSKIYGDPDPTLLTDERYIKSLSKGDLQSIKASDLTEERIIAIEKSGRIGELTPEQISPYIDKLSDNSLMNLGKQHLTYKDSSGTPNINRVSDWDRLNPQVRDQALSEITGKKINTEEPVNGKVVGNGVYFESIKFLKIDQTSITKGIGVVFDGNKLKFKHADSVVTDKSASANVDNFEGFAESYKVEKADSLLSGCLRFDNIKKSSFSIAESKVSVDVEDGNNITITDCSYTQSEFRSKGNGSIIINKNAKPKYEIKEGILNCKYGSNVDKIEAQSRASVDIDNCFTCLTINPPGTYFYSDADIRKDLSINIPKESSTYKLCLRKNSAQQFNDYNGLVDFVNKKIELNGIVNYLRYPLRNNQITSLLSDFVYQGLKNVKTLLVYDNDLLFLNNVAIKNILENKNQITTTKPDNYFIIKEMELEDGKIHRIIELNKLNKNEVNQDVISNYESDNLNAKIAVKDNILVQESGKSRIGVFPPIKNKKD